jgi:hypothetical protein
MGVDRAEQRGRLLNPKPLTLAAREIIPNDKRDLSLEFLFDNVDSRVRPERNPDRIHAFLETYRQIEESVLHSQLQNDLIEPH